MARSFWGIGRSAEPKRTPAPQAPVSQPNSATSSQPPLTYHSKSSNSSQSSQGSAAIDIASPAAQIRGKLRVKISGARNLAVLPNSSPYVVVSCNTSEYISKSAASGGASGMGIAIPRSGHGNQQQQPSRKPRSSPGSANPQFDDEALFDITPNDQQVQVFIYDAANSDKFIGWAMIRLDPSGKGPVSTWLPLQPRTRGEHVSGEVHISLNYERATQHYGPEDFEVLRLIGRGTFGQVFQVRKKDTRRVYAMKVLSKKTIVQKKEIAHTIGERNILVRTSSPSSGANFLVSLKFSFQTATDLYLVTDYMSGGELFWHLQREGRFSEPRAKFYIAELIVALEHLHHNDIVYRDLKPENILLDTQGHVALCDFGLSKANLSGGTTNTFCGTTEYLAPEVLLDDKGYTKMVDFWSLGVLIFEMCCGWSPFYAEDNQQMYKNIAFGKVRFPKDALSPEGRDFVKGLLNRNPKHRLGATNDAAELKAHPFFKDVDWDKLVRREVAPPYKPQVTSEEDTSNFDPEFTQAPTNLVSGISSTPLSPGIQAKFQGFTYVDDTLDSHMQSRLGQSYRPHSFKPRETDGIDLYDDDDIKMSESFYSSTMKSKFGKDYADDDMRMEDVEEEDEEDEEDMRRHSDDDFVEGQGFEM